jgi:hypothetical protein
VNYVDDKNKTLTQSNWKVERSRLILDTAEVFGEVAPLIRAKRYYQAISLLTQQELKLRHMGSEENDKELLRDARILKAYSDHLYNYNDESFQTIKNWYDLSWDAGRFSESFE